MQSLEPFTFDYPFHAFSTSVIIQADSFEWLRRIPPASIHAIVTDPLIAARICSICNPYGNFTEVLKRSSLIGSGSQACNSVYECTSTHTAQGQI